MTTTPVTTGVISICSLKNGGLPVMIVTIASDLVEQIEVSLQRMEFG